MVNNAITLVRRDLGRLSPRQQDFGLALLVAAAVVLIHAWQGFPRIFGPNADNDSLMRMVEVLDFLSGQGWYDLHQYRMGPEGGFLMHWSRFVDAPIAGLLVLAKAVTGSMERAEAIVEVVYPALWMTAAMFLLLRLVRRLGNVEALLPAVVIGALALYSLPLFQGASLDHHNVQLVLVLASILFLMPVPAPDRRRFLEQFQEKWEPVFRPELRENNMMERLRDSKKSGTALAGFGAGMAAALSLVVGMETAPYVAVAGVVAAIAFLFRGDVEHRSAAGFGAGFALVSLLSFLATVPASLWGAPRCDAFTLPQMSVAALAGGGLFAAASIPACRANFKRRLLSLSVLAAAVAALVLFAFPECVAPPFAGLDPKLKYYWLDSVSEAQSIRQVLVAQPAMAATYYCTPLLAALVLGLRLRKGRPGRGESIFGAFLVMAILVSFWQVRGVFFSIPFSVVPLAAWVGDWRARIGDRPSKADAIRLLAVWLVSFNVVWTLIAQSAANQIAPDKASDNGSSNAICVARDDYAALAALPHATVLAVSNLGAPILRYTPQRVLAGPYHRNVEGDLATLNAFIGTDAEARDIARRYGVTIVASCAGNPETIALSRKAPHGLAAHLMKGEVPAWLSPVPSTADQSLKLFRVVQP
jgi:hypothetical protein